MTNNAPSSSTYAMGRSDAETQRLIKQAALYNRITERMVEDAGITSGMRVLDVGTGAGDVALLAAARVGATGSVTAIDTNATILSTARARAAAAGLENLTFREADLRTCSLDDHFDAVVGRHVLMYTPDIGEALRLVSDRVRPRGVVAFQEWDLAPVLGYTAAEAVFKHTGAQTAMSAALYTAFQQAGLGEPRVACWPWPHSSSHGQEKAQTSTWTTSATHDRGGHLA